MEYKFDIEFAKKYGVEEAIMIENFMFWILKNKANKTNFNDGRYWTFNSISAFKEIFSFWSEGQIRRIIQSLINQKVLMTGNYNKSAYDRTIWYAFTDYFICGNQQMDFLKTENRKCENDEPIPYNKTQDNKTQLDKKINKKENSFLESLNEEWKELLTIWINYRKEIKKPLKEVSYPSCFRKLKELSNNNLIVAKQIIEQSIANGWQGLFEIKNNSNGNYFINKHNQFDEAIKASLEVEL